MDKIAFLILAHNDPQHLKKLIYALDYPAFDIYVHVDAKADIEQFGFDKYELKNSELFVLNDRVKVYWADYSQTVAMIKLYQMASDSVTSYLKYVMLSGNDYPLVTNDIILETLSNNAVEFIKGNPCEQMNKVKYYHYMHYNTWVGKLVSYAIRQFHIIRNKKSLVIDNKELTIYFSPTWNALSESSVELFLKSINDNSEIIDHYFKYSYASDELLIPTILFNDESFRKKALRAEFPLGTHYNEMPAIHYINYEPVVQVFTEQDAENLLTSGKLFARKFRSGMSDGLVRIIDEARKQ